MLKEISTEQKFDVTYVEVGENQEEFENYKGIPYLRITIKFFSSTLSIPHLNEGVQYDSALIAVLLWIRIQWGPWIRIRIRNLDPDPGGQNQG
jgi:hypothetical protein